VAKWRRPSILVLCALAASLLAFLVPVPAFYQPMIAVPLFVAFARMLRVSSYSATLVFALLPVSALVVMFSVVAAASSDWHLYEAFYWSIMSISGLPALIVFFLLPIAIGVATYAGRRWLYP